MEKIGNQALLHLLYLSISLNWSLKLKRTRLINSLILMSIDSTNSIQKPALSQIPSTRKSPRKRIFRENEHADFIANNAISIFDNITEKNCSGTTFIRYDDHIVLCRQIKKNVMYQKLQIASELTMRYLWSYFYKVLWTSSTVVLLIYPLSANPTKWPNTLKQFVGNLPTNYLSVWPFCEIGA